MDYAELASQFFQKMQMFRNKQHQKMITEPMQGEMFALIYIAQKGDSVLPGEIGSEMNISSARVAAALKNLEKKGLITRQIDLTDRRKILVSLTVEGKNFAEHHREMASSYAIKMLEFLGEHDAMEFIRIIGRLTEYDPKCTDTE